MMWPGIEPRSTGPLANTLPTKENSFTLKKGTSKWFPTETIMDANYTDDLVFFANTPAQAKSMLHSLEQTASGIGLHVNSDKTDFICSKQNGAISTLNDQLLKLLD